MSAPKLRFKEYSNNYLEIKYDNFAPLQRGFDLPVSTIIDGEFPVVFSNGILKTHKEFKAKAPGVVTGRSGTIGNITWVEKDYWPHNTSLWVTNFFNNEPKYVFYFLQKFDVSRFASGSGVPTLNRNDVHAQLIEIPSNKQEQTKIASFLSSVDEKISQLTQKHELLSQYKQGMMQKLFSQQIRFKADDSSEFGEWEEKPLNHYLYTSKLKNKDLKFSKQEVLSVSGELGVVNQIELLGRSYAGVSVAPYGVVEHGDIVYTKSPLKSNPYGIIKANKGKPGIVSTLYAIYKCKKNVSPNLVDYYFQNDLKLNHFLKPLVKKGAKNDMKVNNDHVLTGLVIFPSSMEEQTKIANFLLSIDQKIEVVTQQIDQAKQWKKGLLQQMFV